MANRIDVFKKFYSELTKVLPMIINNLVTTLYSNELLSGDKKGLIDSLSTDNEKTEYLLDKVIRPGLEIKYTEQFDEMFRMMRTSDNPAVNYLIDMIDKFSSTPKLLCVDQKQATSRGNYTRRCIHTHARARIYEYTHTHTNPHTLSYARINTFTVSHRQINACKYVYSVHMLDTHAHRQTDTSV